MKNKKHISFISTIIIAAVISLFFSCKKNPSIPPLNQVALGKTTYIDSLRNLYLSHGKNIKFTSNTILRAVVTCDESSGNLYKQVYVRDNSGEFAATKYYGAISLRFLRGTAGFLTVGDSIAVNLNGATLDQSSGGSIEIDSLDAINSIVHLKSGLNPQPLVVTLPQLNSYSATPSNPALRQYIYDAQLVQLNKVEFIESNVGTTYAIYQPPPVIAAPKNVNKYICDSAGNTIIAYNSGYANFATQVIPNNSGSVVAVANLYTIMQLTIRSDANGDINLNMPYIPTVYDAVVQNFSCAALFAKTTVYTAGWTAIHAQGALNWQGGQYGNPPAGFNAANWHYALDASNYKTNDIINEMWLVSPPIVDHGGGVKKYMDFATALQYGTTARCLSVWVSGNFNGSVSNAQWTEITSLYPHISTTSNNGPFPPFIYASTGNSSVPAALPGFTPPTNNGTFNIAFKYRTNTNYTDSTGMTYLINSFIVRNNP